jgi:hypothetical protein
MPRISSVRAVWRLTPCVAGCLAVALCPALVPAAAPTVAEALKLEPRQQGVDFERPTADEAAAATIKQEKLDGVSALVVRAADGRILRAFADVNGDRVVDRWSYFKDGLEYYRELDGDDADAKAVAFGLVEAIEGLRAAGLLVGLISQQRRFGLAAGLAAEGDVSQHAVKELSKPFRPSSGDSLQDAVLPKTLDEQVLHGIIDIAAKRRTSPATLEIASGHRLVEPHELGPLRLAPRSCSINQRPTCFLTAHAQTSTGNRLARGDYSLPSWTRHTSRR